MEIRSNNKAKHRSPEASAFEIPVVESLHSVDFVWNFSVSLYI